jgi:hypothetical protein
LDYFNADISSGVSLSVVGDKIPEDYSFFRWSDQLDTGNVLFRKDILIFTGLLDKQFEGQTQEDAEFGLRFHLCGFIAISNPLASRVHFKAPIGGMREVSGWDSLRPKNLISPHPVPSVLYLARKYFGTNFAILILLLSIPSSIVPYKYKSYKWLKILAGFFMIFLWPFIILQVIISWHKAELKLQQGAMIETLK